MWDTLKISRHWGWQLNSTLQWVQIHLSQLHVHDVPSQVNPERNPFGYVPQHNAPDPVQSAFPHSHWVLTPNQAGAENLRRLASRYLHHPDAQVAMVSMEAGAAGRYKIVITIGLHDVL